MMNDAIVKCFCVEGLNKSRETYSRPTVEPVPPEYGVLINQLWHSVNSTQRLPLNLMYEGVSKSFRTESITKYTLNTINTR